MGKRIEKKVGIHCRIVYTTINSRVDENRPRHWPGGREMLVRYVFKETGRLGWIGCICGIKDREESDSFIVSNDTFN